MPEEMVYGHLPTFIWFGLGLIFSSCFVVVTVFYQSTFMGCLLDYSLMIHPPYSVGVWDSGASNQTLLFQEKKLNFLNSCSHSQEKMTHGVWGVGTNCLLCPFSCITRGLVALRRLPLGEKPCHLLVGAENTIKITVATGIFLDWWNSPIWNCSVWHNFMHLSKPIELYH